MDDHHDQLEALRARVEALEWENARLRGAVEGAGVTTEVAAWFDPKAFRAALGRLALTVQMPLMLLFFVGVAVAWLTGIGGQFIEIPGLPPLPVLDLGRGGPTGIAGTGVGLIACGGVAIGLVACGGLAVGVVAFGGGAVGLVAIGGGAVGLFAFGGGALGYVAIGGGACGVYAMGERGRGRHVLALNRQDEKAARFFSRFVPKLSLAVTKPMPVVLDAEAA